MAQHIITVETVVDDETGRKSPLGWNAWDEGVVAEAAGASRVIKVGENRAILSGVSGNDWGFGENWLWCGCVVLVVVLRSARAVA